MCIVTNLSVHDIRTILLSCFILVPKHYYIYGVYVHL